MHMQGSGIRLNYGHPEVVIHDTNVLRLALILVP